MIARVLLLAAAFLAGAASTSVAQQKEPLPRGVIDVRGASVGLPTVAGWTPPVPEGTVVPSRSYGLDVGGHLYIWRGRVVALGIGAAVVMSKGTTSPAEPAGAQLTVAPKVATRLTSLAPQLSINFGHRLGWSYISGGVGRARVKADVSRRATLTSPTLVEIGWVETINYGGGARWFINDHIAFNLDLRWHKLPSVSATATQSAAGRTSLIVAGGGISIK
jgi:opacity protein-like surface antigen